MNNENEEIHTRDLLPAPNKDFPSISFIIIAETDRSEPGFEVIGQVDGLAEGIENSEDALKKFLQGPDYIPPLRHSMIGVIPWCNIHWNWLEDT